MIKNHIPRLSEPILLADIKNSIPPMYQHRFIVHFTHRKEGINHAGFVKVQVNSTDPDPTLSDLHQASAMAKEKAKGLGFRGLFFGKPQLQKTLRLPNQTAQ